MTNPSLQQLFEDMSRLFGSALSTAGNVKGEAERQFRARMAEWLASMDVPSREEVNVLRDMLSKAREEQEALKSRIEALEKAQSGAKKK